jgi:streptomycin 6-kinase
MAELVDVPHLVRERALSGGVMGKRWLSDLPDVLATLANEWQLQLGAPFGGGTAGYVTTAVDASGRECVVKVAMVLDGEEHEAFARSVRVHQLAAGRGCAELLAHDEARCALLLERLGPNLHDVGMPLPDLLDTIADTLRSFWRPAHGAVDLPTGAEKAAWLARSITTTWDELGRPCEREVVERALAYCEARAAAFDPGQAVLVHGDAHGWNTVRAEGRDHKLVDAEGLRSEPEHDLAVPMREYNLPLLAGDTAHLARRRAEVLAARCDADPQKVWEWGYVERVSTGLGNLRDFDNDDGAAFLEVARRCL